MATDNKQPPARFQGTHVGASDKIDGSKLVAPIDQARKELAAMDSQFKAALPAHITAEKFNRVVMTALQQTPELLRVDRKSLLSSCMRCAQDGLLPDGRDAALVIFGNAAVYMPMIGGILRKMRNSGELASITANVIYSEDKFRYWIDSEGEHLEHEPLLFGQRGTLIGTYGLAKTKDGSIFIEVMTEDQMSDVKKVSRAKNGPWNGPFADEMRKKTVIRRLSKRMPMSTDLENVIKRDDEMYDLKQAPEKGDLLARLDSADRPEPTTPDLKVVDDTEDAVLGGEQEGRLTNFVFTSGRFSGQDVQEISQEDLRTYFYQLKGLDRTPENTDNLQKIGAFLNIK